MSELSDRPRQSLFIFTLTRDAKGEKNELKRGAEGAQGWPKRARVLQACCWGSLRSMTSGVRRQGVVVPVRSRTFEMGCTYCRSQTDRLRQLQLHVVVAFSPSPSDPSQRHGGPGGWHCLRRGRGLGVAAAAARVSVVCTHPGR